MAGPPSLSNDGRCCDGICLPNASKPLNMCLTIFQTLCKVRTTPSKARATIRAGAIAARASYNLLWLFVLLHCYHGPLVKPSSLPLRHTAIEHPSRSIEISHGFCRLLFFFSPTARRSSPVCSSPSLSRPTWARANVGCTGHGTSQLLHPHALNLFQRVAQVPVTGRA